MPWPAWPGSFAWLLLVFAFDDAEASTSCLDLRRDYRDNGFTVARGPQKAFGKRVLTISMRVNKLNKSVAVEQHQHYCESESET